MFLPDSVVVTLRKNELASSVTCSAWVGKRVYDISEVVKQMPKLFPMEGVMGVISSTQASMISNRCLELQNSTVAISRTHAPRSSKFEIVVLVVELIHCCSPSSSGT
jgi:hypothetical protein